MADFASPGKQSSEQQRKGDPHSLGPVPVVGKGTLVEQLHHMMEHDPLDASWLSDEPARDEVDIVRSLSGRTFRDGGTFKFECLASGDFVVREVPAGTKNARALGKVISARKDASGWRRVLDAMYRALPETKPADREARSNLQLAPRRELPHLAMLPSRSSEVSATTQGRATSSPVDRSKDPAVSKEQKRKAAAEKRSAERAEKLKRSRMLLQPEQVAVVDTLTLALKKIDSSLDTAYYHRGGDSTAAQLTRSGSDDAKEFYCSAFSMWTLAKAGYNMNALLTDSSGEPFTFREIKRAAKGTSAKELAKLRTGLTDDEIARLGLAEDEYIDPAPKTIKFQHIIDGWDSRTGAVREFLRRKPSTHCDLGAFRAETTDQLYGVEGMAAPGRGAASAFEAFGVGVEVPELEQKPGDFAQAWSKDDNGMFTRGHAFQVATVTAYGRALFGEANSPVLLAEGGSAPDMETTKGEQDGVWFLINEKTDPRYVGEHTVAFAQRAEATFADHVGPKKNRVAIKTAWDPGANGGIRVDKADVVPTPTTNGARVYYGRLGNSRWTGYKPSF